MELRVHRHDRPGRLHDVHRPAREPRPLPRMWINPDVKDLFAFRFEDFRLEDYDPHPHISAPVAV